MMPRAGPRSQCGFEVEVKFARLANRLDDHILTVVLSIRDSRIGNIRQSGRQRVQFGSRLRRLVYPTLRSYRRPRASPQSSTRRAAASFICPISFETVLRSALSISTCRRAGRGAFHPTVEWNPQGMLHLAVFQRLADNIRFFANEIDIQHVAPPCAVNRIRPGPFAGRGASRGATCFQPPPLLRTPPPF